MVGVIVVFVGTIFFVWGAGGKLGKRRPTALKINGDEITYNRFKQIYRQMSERQRRRNVDPEQIRQQTIDAITKQYLLLQQVEQFDINISDKEINDKIQADNQSLMRYQMYKKRGLADTYRKEIKSQMGLQRLGDERTNKGILFDLALVTDNEIQQEYRRKNEKVKIKYIEFPKSAFRDKVEIDDKEAENYFQKNKEKYRVNEQANVKFIKIDPKKMVADKDINEYYAENKNEFRELEKVKARHILLKVDANASEDEKKKVKEEAQEILAKAKKEGADFAALAKKYSEDPGSAKKGGDLGYFERGKMVKEFEEAAFSLKPGEISDLVKTSYGYHIIKVEDKKPAAVPSLEKVKSKVKQKIVEQVTVRDAKEIADELLFDVEVGSFEDAIKQKNYLKAFTDDKKENYSDLKLEVKTTGLFEKDVSSIPNIGSKWTYGDLVEKAFDMRKSVVDTVEVKGYRGDINSYFVVELLDKKATYIPKFAEIKDDVKDDMKDEKAGELALKTANRLMSKLTNEDALEDLAKRYEQAEDKKEKEVKESKLFTLSSRGYISGLGRARKVMVAAFNMELNEVAGPFKGNKGAYIIQLTEREKPDLKKLSADKKQLVKSRKELLKQREDQIYQNWYKGIKGQAKIVDNTTR